MRDLEHEIGLELLRITGGLHLAPNDSVGNAEIGSYARALTEQGHAYEVMDGTELHTRWPQWRVGADVIGLCQAESGILDIRRVNSAHISRARAYGVRFLDRTPARKIVPCADHVEVHTDSDVFEAGTLTICAGSWTETLTAGLGLDLPLTLTQEQVSYFVAADLRAFTPDRFPVWIFHGHDRTFYGFPVYGEAAVKAARDMSGRFVTQQTHRFEPDPEQTAEVAEFLARYLPGAVGPELVSKTCVYDLTADRNFILDTILGHPRIGLFVGAGHAAKFAGLIGHVLADLAIDGRTDYSSRRWPTEPAHKEASVALGGLLHQIPQLLDVLTLGGLGSDRDPDRPGAVQQGRRNQSGARGVDRVHPGERVRVQRVGVQHGTSVRDDAGGFVPEHDGLQVDRGQDTPAGGRRDLLGEPASVVQIPA